eukprot:GFKZ01014965.1.p1 GENE.GFKZ01014965.1~~GFKZ01014965.1.p1  ORF type:complete len:877 (-),score=106.28 GFKZ01014965.1:1404-4034(-)
MAHFPFSNPQLPFSHYADYDAITDDDSEDSNESDPLASNSEGEEPPSSNTHQLPNDIFAPSMGTLLAESFNRKRRRRRSRMLPGTKRARKSDVPRHLEKVMGKASFAYMSNKFEEAESLLQSVLDEAPNTSAAYRMLALMWEERGEGDKALETYMKAAELDMGDRDLWKRNAVMWEERGELEKSIFCLSRALRGTALEDRDALMARADLYMRLEKFRMAANSFIQVSRLEPMNTHIARFIFDAYAKARCLHRAVPVLEDMVRFCERNAPRGRGADAQERHELQLGKLVEILVEVHFREKAYHEALMLLAHSENRNRSKGRPLPFVHKLMMAISQYRLGSETLASATLLEFLRSPSATAKHRFLLWQVAEAYRDRANFTNAARAYTELSNVEDPDELVEVFLQRALCHKELKDREGARRDLETVLQLDGSHVEASLRLVEFLDDGETFNCRRGDRVVTIGKGSRYSRDIASLKPRAGSGERKQGAELLHNANLLYEGGDYGGYLAHLYPALEAALRVDAVDMVRDDGGEESGEDLDDDSLLLGDEEGRVPARRQRRSVGDQGKGSDVIGRFSGRHLGEEQQAKLQMLGGAIMRATYGEAFVAIVERMVESFRVEGNIACAYGVTRVFESLSHLKAKNSNKIRWRLKMWDISVCLAAGDFARAHEHARVLAIECPLNADAWYAFFLADHHMSTLGDGYHIRSARCIARLVKKYPRSLFMLIVGGNVSSRGGVNSRSYALGMYLRAYKIRPTNALICLCVGVQLLHVVMSRRVLNRNERVSQALGFLNEYRKRRLQGHTKLRSKWLEMEGDYNLGRAMHELGLVEAASFMYRKVLRAGGASIPVWLDLRRDAAYNLAQIYRQKGAVRLAGEITQRYLMF